MWFKRKKVVEPPPTQKQLDYIKRLEYETGITIVNKPKSKLEASAIIDHLLHKRDG